METLTVLDNNRIYEFMLAKAKENKLGNETIAKITSKQLKLDEEPLYVRKTINGFANSVDLLDSGDDNVIGTTNIQNRKLAADEYFFIDSIYIGWGNSVATAAASSAYTSVATTVAPAVRNGEFRLIQSGNVLIKQPVATLLALAARPGSIREQATPLRDVQMLLPGQQIEFKIECANGQSAAGNDSIEVFLFGGRTKQVVWG